MTTNRTTAHPAPTRPTSVAQDAHAHTSQCFWDLQQARWSCEAVHRLGPPRVDVPDLLLVRGGPPVHGTARP